MICHICDTEMKLSFSKKILNKYNVQYFLCPNCGYLTTEEAFWLDEAYTTAIAATDVGLISRNIQNSRQLINILYFLFGKENKYVDISGGYGILCRIMRDCGFNYYWEDLYCPNLFSQGFEASAEDHFHAASLFEVIEHTKAPLYFIKSMFDKYKLKSLIFTTNLYEEKTLSPNWWYLAPETGQHISFFKRETLIKMAMILNVNFYTISNMYIFSQEKLSPLIISLCSKSKIKNILNILAKMGMTSRLMDDYIYLRSKIK
mgnify:CR=1 FL=1